MVMEAGMDMAYPAILHPQKELKSFVWRVYPALEEIHTYICTRDVRWRQGGMARHAGGCWRQRESAVVVVLSILSVK